MTPILLFWYVLAGGAGLFCCGLLGLLLRLLWFQLDGYLLSETRTEGEKPKEKRTTFRHPFLGDLE